MTGGSEIDDRVDLDEDNYMEETEYDIDEDQEEDVEDDSRDLPDEKHSDEYDELNPKGTSDDDSSEKNKMPMEEQVQNTEKKSFSSNNYEDNEKYAQLLSLPPHGSEVFIGGLPKNILEEDLRDLCDPIGDVSEIRIVKDKDTGEGKGFAFVSFQSKEVAQKAIEELHTKNFKGKTLRCSLSEIKNRLFIGNVPKNWTEDEFKRLIEEVGPGVEVIELIKDPQNSTRNRGFAFVLYYNNACADYSRHKMLSGNFKLDGNTPTISWADPKTMPSDHSAVSSNVKALYVKNIPENTSTEKVKELFQHHGEIIKVVMPPGKAGKRDFAFIHFSERSSALKAVKDSEKYEIDGKALEVMLAKPQSDKKDNSYPHISATHSNHSPYPSYGGISGTSYGSGFGVQQPVIYGRGPMPSGMHMVPMVLPDGRLGYVLQQPGVQMPQSRPRRVDHGGGSGGRTGGGGDDGHRSKRYRPY